MSSSESTPQASALDEIIAAEVYEDAFSKAIRNVASFAPIDTVLEIGSSSGEGSTLAWVQGLRLNPRKPTLYCIEVSRARWEALEQRWGGEGFVNCTLGSSVDLSQFPTPAQVQHFYETVDGPLRRYPLEQVLGWLQADIDYIKSQGTEPSRIQEIKRAYNIENFGAVLIDGSEFTGNAELDEVYGAEYILLDDTQTYKCYEAHQRLLRDPGYELVEEDPHLRHGYSVFRKRHGTRLDALPEDVPVHFLTMVLNGEPFIRHHIEVLRQLSFEWRWHIVEGVAELKHDTGWSLAAGGKIPEGLHDRGLSVDGTSAYLDELAREFPDNVKIYRKPQGKLWDGKLEMVSEPLKTILKECVLWEIDADELWTVEQLEKGRRLFIESPEKTAAYFWCHYFVGERAVVAGRHCYAQNPAQEWLRAWRFRPGMRWLTHEPPVLEERLHDGTWQNVAGGKVFTHAETEAAGLVFQHMAYVTEQQAAFKEDYYGYAGAVASWKALQAAEGFPLPLGRYLPWVKDHTMVDTVEALGIVPLAVRSVDTGRWAFSDRGLAPQGSRRKDAIIVDGVFFQLNNTGITRVWVELLSRWGRTELADRVWLLDRDGTAPEIPGIRRHVVGRYDFARTVEDSDMLQDTCDLLGAGVFISTYFTVPRTTSNVAMVYDMIPELLHLSGDNPDWKAKTLCVLQASRWVCISECTARDLSRVHPELPQEHITVAYPGAGSAFTVPAGRDVEDFRRRQQLTKPYIIVTGERVGIKVNTQGYKNAALVFKAWSLLPPEARRNLTILCTGGKAELEEELSILVSDANVEMDVRLVRLSEADLNLAYAGAVALVYPSLYEGFGLPVVEAMASGCPVITCRSASLAEVGGDAVQYVSPWDAQETADAIHTLLTDGAARERLVSLGREQATRFSFDVMAQAVGELLTRELTAPRTKVREADAKIRSALRHETAALAQHINALGAVRTEREVRIAALQTKLKESVSELKKEKAQHNKAKKSLSKLKEKLKEEKRKRRRRFRRFWDRFFGRKPAAEKEGAAPK